jgi:hypothetical protein
MSTINLGDANILTALDFEAIGTKVYPADVERFIDIVIEAIQSFDFTTCREPGQGLIHLPSEACDMVSAGVGRRTSNPSDYLVREHRDKVSLYLRRGLAAIPDKVAVVVYTIEAYLNDPDIKEEEAARVRKGGFTHMLVAVLASAGPSSPLTPGRFVSNLAGGNNEALHWTADEIRAKAKEIDEYAKTWCVVAD